MKSCDHCGSLNHDNHKQCWCCSSSDLSACLGADAQLADQASAVPPRLGDGPAWLAELLLWMKKEIKQQDQLLKKSGDEYHMGVSDGYACVRQKILTLVKQGQSK